MQISINVPPKQSVILLQFPEHNMIWFGIGCQWSNQRSASMRFVHKWQGAAGEPTQGLITKITLKWLILAIVAL